MTPASLEHEALEAFRTGTRWAEFWSMHRGDINPANMRRLFSLVVSGDTSNIEPMPILVNLADCHPDDTQTQAKWRGNE